MLRIIAGEFRSRLLRSPEDASVSRPYSGRVKESVFSLLRGWFEGAVVLDLFAGVGTVGLECVSRGAKRVYMVEANRDISRLLRENIADLKCEDRAVVIQADALSPAALASILPPVDLIFVDPPYPLVQTSTGPDRVRAQIQRCRSLMADRGFVVLRLPFDASHADLRIPGFDGPEQHAYSHGMFVMLYAPSTSSADFSGGDPPMMNGKS
ncbi:MAG TPA: RsmD family RNA methyltransferase [Phycisphaerales bacterium]|nr:RsmD family RNA methyltransferase [Phycisphaerales bacterium]